MNRADILEAFHRGTFAKTARTTVTKSCQLHARGPPFFMWRPLWDVQRVGWSVCIVHVTTPGHIVGWQPITVESWTNWLSADWQTNQDLSVCLSACASICSQHPYVMPLPLVQNGQIWCFLSPSLCLYQTSMVLFFCRWCSLSSFHSASIPFPSLTSLKFLRCASSCVAPSDPTARNTCNRRERNRERLVTNAGKEVCFVDRAKCCF